MIFLVFVKFRDVYCITLDILPSFSGYKNEFIEFALLYTGKRGDILQVFVRMSAHIVNVKGIKPLEDTFEIIKIKLVITRERIVLIYCR